MGYYNFGISNFYAVRNIEDSLRLYDVLNICYVRYFQYFINILIGLLKLNFIL